MKKEKVFLMTIALMSILVLSGCNYTRSEYSVDFSEYEKGTSVVIIGDGRDVGIMRDCAERGGELTIKNNLFGKLYVCTVDLSKD